jgi:hypothetical protein
MRKPKLIRKRSSGRTEADRDVELFLANEQVCGMRLDHIRVFYLLLVKGLSIAGFCARQQC